jgi:hypothetical protein
LPQIYAGYRRFYFTLVQYKFSRRDAETQRRGSQGEKRKWGMILEVQKFGNSLTKWDASSLVFGLSWYSLCVSAPPRDLFWTVMILLMKYCESIFYGFYLRGSA